MKPILTDFCQLAYVTNDIDEAMALYARRYGVPSFYRLDVDLPSEVDGSTGVIKLKIALANVAGVQIELMEPVADLGGFYGSTIAGQTGLAFGLHHVCQKVVGDIAEWEAHIAELGGPDRPIACSARAGDYARIVFTDDRALLGAYIEHIWMTPAAWADIASKVPFHSG